MSGEILREGSSLMVHYCDKPDIFTPASELHEVPVVHHTTGTVWRCECGEIWVVIRDSGEIGAQVMMRCWPFDLEWAPASWKIRRMYRKGKLN